MRPIKIASVNGGLGALEYALRDRLKRDIEITFMADGMETRPVIDYRKESQIVRKKPTIEEKMAYISKLRLASEIKGDGTYKYSTAQRENFSKKIYMKNFPEVKYYFDVPSLVDARDFKGEVDIMFITLSDDEYDVKYRLGGVDDIRNTDFFLDFVRLVREINPKVFIFEIHNRIMYNKNDPHYNKDSRFKIIMDGIHGIGYKTTMDKRAASLFNVPHNKARRYMVGFRDEEDFNRFEFPKELELKYTMRDFLLFNSPLGHFAFNQDGTVDTAVANPIVPHAQEVKWEKEIICTESVVKFALDKPANFRGVPNPNPRLALPINKSSSDTQRASLSNYVSEDVNDLSVGSLRKLHPREMMRLHGFGDEYKIDSLSRSRLTRIVGRGGVVDVLMHLFLAIEKAIDGKWDEVVVREMTRAERLAKLGFKF